MAVLRHFVYQGILFLFSGRMKYIDLLRMEMNYIMCGQKLLFFNFKMNNATWAEINYINLMLAKINYINLMLAEIKLY